GNFKRASFSDDAGTKNRCFSRLYLNLKPKFAGNRAHFFHRRRLDEEMLESAARGSVLRRVNGAAVPFDEKGQNAVEIVFQCEGPPLQRLAVRADARTVARILYRNAGGNGLLHQTSQIIGMRSPADYPRLLNGTQTTSRIIARSCARLLRIGRDDFQVAARAQGEKGVAGTASGMYAAEDRTHAAALLHPVDTMIKISSADKDVVEIDRNAGHIVSSQGDAVRSHDHGG